MAYHTELCDKVVTYLNGLSGLESFTAVRKNLPIDQIDTAGDLNVIVYPGPRRTESQGRRDSERVFTVNVLIAEKIDSDSEASEQTRQDQLIDLSEQLEIKLEHQSYTVASGPTFRWMQQESEGAGIDPMEIEEVDFSTFVVTISSEFITVI